MIDNDPNDTRTKEEYDNTPKADAGTIFDEENIVEVTEPDGTTSLADGGDLPTNPNNCESCEHMAFMSPEALAAAGHCYMFADEPTEVCMQHTGRLSSSIALLTDSRDISSMAAILTNIGACSALNFGPPIITARQQPVDDLEAEEQMEGEYFNAPDPKPVVDPSYLYDEGFGCVYFLLVDELMDAPMTANDGPDWDSAGCVIDWDIPMAPARQIIIKAALQAIKGEI